MRFEPKLGKEFPLEVKVLEAKTRRVTETTRSVIALSVLGIGAAALAIAAVVSFATGNWGAVVAVWAAIAAPWGMVIGYYFRGNGVNEEHNPGSA